MLKEAEEASAFAEKVLNRPLDDAYSAILRKADRLVEKSGGGMSQDSAVVEVLKASPDLYDDYCAALESRQREEADAEQTVRRADLDQWQREQAAR